MLTGASIIDYFIKQQMLLRIRRWITASCEAGPLKRVRLDVLLRDIDDDHDLVGHDHHAGTAFPIIEENNYVIHLLPGWSRVCREANSAYASCPNSGI